MASRRKAVPARLALSKRNKRGASGVVYAVEKLRRVGGSPPGSPRGPSGYGFRDPDGEPPDPDDNPGVNVAAISRPLSLKRNERMNIDTEFYTGVTGGLALWSVPRETFVGIARGSDYAQRATSFVRLERIAVKLIAEQPSISSFNTNTVNPLHADPVNVFNKCFFRLAVIYDKQCDGSDPTLVYPNVYSTAPTYATLSFRNPAFVHRYDVLYDNTFEWETGEITEGTFSTVPGEFTSWWAQTGNRQREEFFIELDKDKLVHFNGDTGAVGTINAGNVFVMFNCIGNTYANTSIWFNVRVTYSDNL